MYFWMYVDKFDLKKCIWFKFEIECVFKSEDFVEMGRWKFKIKDMIIGVFIEEIFDVVVVCIGYYVYKYYVKFLGIVISICMY